MPDYIAPTFAPPQLPSAYSIDTAALLKTAFGAAVGYVPPVPAQQQQGQEYVDNSAAVDDGSIGFGPMGLRIFSEITFRAGVNRKTGVAFQEVTLADALVEVSVPATIVATRVPGRDGTVKEFISLGDKAVTIRHICANTFGGGSERRYPNELVRLLNRLPRSQELAITSRELRRFGIDYLVIEEMTWPRMPGFTNLQPVEIKALSDTPEDID